MHETNFTHKSLFVLVGQSKVVDNDSDSKAEDTDSVKHFDTNDTENQSDPAANVKVCANYIH